MTVVVITDTSINPVVIEEATATVVEVADLRVRSYVNEDEPFRFNGAVGNTYLKYNFTTSKLELYVNGAKKKEWS